MKGIRIPWFAALLVVVALLARLLPGPRTIDDAYITFRYARSLLAGQGLVFNPGEAVLGTTTPLYTLLMAALAAPAGPGADFPALALGVNALADAVTCLLLWQLGRELGLGRAGAAAALAWALAPFSVTFALGGLETSLYIALLSGAAWAAAGRRRLAVALCASLALLTRPDALILLGPLALERLWSAWRGERIRLAELAAALLPYGAWALYATLVYGSPLPHSILAKAAAYHLEPSDGLVRLIQHYATPFLEPNLLGAPLAVGLGLLLYPSLSVLGARRLLRANPRLLPWLLYPWLYFAVFAAANPLIFRWYLAPPLPAYFLMIFAGLDDLLQKILLTAEAQRARSLLLDAEAEPQHAKQAVLLRVLRACVVNALLLLPVLVSLSDWGEPIGGGALAPRMAYIELEKLYQQAAARVAAQLAPGSRPVLAAGDVGVLGYDLPVRILDTVGLNSPAATRFYPLPAGQYVINYAVPTGLILEQDPDWVVILEVYGRRTLLVDADFQARYRLLETLPTDIYGSHGLLIFQRARQ